MTEKSQYRISGLPDVKWRTLGYDHLSCTGPCRRQMDQFDRTAGMGCDDRGGEEKEKMRDSFKACALKLFFC